MRLLEQGDLVADKLVDYLNRHSEIAEHCGTQEQTHFFTTGNTDDFQQHAQSFYGKMPTVNHIQLG